jgi:hypothetical protein
MPKILLRFFDERVQVERSTPISRILYPPKGGGNHSSRPAVTGRLERSTRKRRLCRSINTERTTPETFPYLILHHEEFTWPQVVANRAGELLPHRFTHHHPKMAGLFSVALVVARLPPNARILSGSLSCGVRTFLFRLDESDCPACSFRTASRSITKNVEQLNSRYKRNFYSRPRMLAAFRTSGGMRCDHERLTASFITLTDSAAVEH